MALAKALGGQDGEIVRRPGDVRAAVRRGVDYVLREQRSYILDMRTAQAPDPTPTVPFTVTEKLARYAAQPPLDVFHDVLASDQSEESVPITATDIPIVF